ncbi:MAG: hypothetical protein AB1489_24175 [Acidobacteriota bacterium]
MSENPFKNLARELKAAEQNLRTRIEDDQHRVLIVQQQESNFLDSLVGLLQACQQAARQFNESYGQQKLRIDAEEQDQALNRASGQRYANRFAIAGVGCFTRLVISADIGKRALHLALQPEVRSEMSLPPPLVVPGYFDGAQLAGWQYRNQEVDTTGLAFELVKWLVAEEARIRQKLAQSPPPPTVADSSTPPSNHRRWWQLLLGRSDK